MSQTMRQKATIPGIGVHRLCRDTRSPKYRSRDDNDDECLQRAAARGCPQPLVNLIAIWQSAVPRLEQSRLRCGFFRADEVGVKLEARRLPHY